MNTDTLSFRWLHRPAERDEHGNGVNERHSLDFVVGGRSLQTLLDPEGREYAGVLGWGCPEYGRETIDGLLLKAPGPTPGGRHMLYVCPECGDLGCGAFTVEIIREQGRIVWQHFSYEEHNELRSNRCPLDNVGPFAFEEGHYREAIEAAASMTYEHTDLASAGGEQRLR